MPPATSSRRSEASCSATVRWFWAITSGLTAAGRYVERNNSISRSPRLAPGSARWSNGRSETRRRSASMRSSSGVACRVEGPTRTKTRPSNLTGGEIEAGTSTCAQAAPSNSARSTTRVGGGRMRPSVRISATRRSRASSNRQARRGAVIPDADEQVADAPSGKVVGERADRLAECVAVADLPFELEVVALVMAQPLGEIWLHPSILMEGTSIALAAIRRRHAGKRRQRYHCRAVPLSSVHREPSREHGAYRPLSSFTGSTHRAGPSTSRSRWRPSVTSPPRCWPVWPRRGVRMGEPAATGYPARNADAPWDEGARLGPEARRGTGARDPGPPRPVLVRRPARVHGRDPRRLDTRGPRGRRAGALALLQPRLLRLGPGPRAVARPRRPRARGADRGDHPLRVRRRGAHHQRAGGAGGRGADGHGRAAHLGRAGRAVRPGQPA